MSAPKFTPTEEQLARIRDAGDYYDRKDAERRHHMHLADEARARGDAAAERQHRDAAERAAYVGD